MKRIKEELYEIYRALDGQLQRNWVGLLLIAYVIIMIILAFHPERVDFDAISADLP